MEDGKIRWRRCLYRFLCLLNGRTEVILTEKTLAPGLIRVEEFSINVTMKLFVVLHEHQLAFVSVNARTKIAFIVFFPRLE